MNNTGTKLKLVNQGWKKLKQLRTIPIDLERVALIRDRDSQYLSNPGNLESLICCLGLNNEGLKEFPVSLHSYCGQGLRIWQYPIQFSQYLVALSKLGITSYLELGVRHGGTFVATVEYLSKFNPIEYAVGVDIIPCPSLVEYQQINPNAKFAQINTQSDDFKKMLNQYKRFGLVLIDSFHEEVQCRNEFLSIKEHVDVIAFHDISNVNYPGVRKVWNEVKSMEDYDCFEFIDQYKEIELSYMGIGVAVRRHKLDEPN